MPQKHRLKGLFTFSIIVFNFIKWNLWNKMVKLLHLSVQLKYIFKNKFNCIFKRKFEYATFEFYLIFTIFLNIDIFAYFFKDLKMYITQDGA